MKRLLPIALSMMLLTGCAVGAALLNIHGQHEGSRR